MKNVRVWFKKDNECRYISHLDLNRCMLRALHKSRIPIWHTEGYNIHPYATFPLPLSLGFKGEKECMDIRLVEDYDFEQLGKKLNECLPDGIYVYDVTEPIMKAKEIAFASFRIRVTSEDIKPDKLFELFKELLEKEEITVEKKTKKKGVKEINIKSYLDNLKLERNIGGVILYVTLPAGSVTNINPTLIQKAFERCYDTEVYFNVTKTDMYDKNLKSFV
ncbi:MAG: TIGR03936 family radical SAM-associated protein [Ruminococcus sp.]|nr:TIGR03936 family radical SAM-associated protein [Ruminococcus sp.]